MMLRQQVDELHLQPVRVLIFVDQNELELPLKMIRRRAFLPQKIHAFVE